MRVTTGQLNAQRVAVISSEATKSGRSVLAFEGGRGKNLPVATLPVAAIN